MERLSTAIFNFIILFFIVSFDCCICRNMTVACIGKERKALLKFKESLSDPWHQLSSWNGDNCCSWKGVLCTQTTGHVVKLDLGPANAENVSHIGLGLSGREVNSFLLDLNYLNYLDLSRNNFQDSSIPEFFGSMKRLRYLNLSDANFRGIVPHHLGNLSSLRVLDLSRSMHALRIDDAMWISQLSLLQQLDLSGVNLTRAEDVGKALYMLPSIVNVSLSHCGLGNLHLSQAYGNSSLHNVQFLDVSSNSFEGEFSHFILNLTSVQVLDLSDNHFNSSILSLSGLRSLAHLDLDANKLNNIDEGFSTFLWNKCNLKTLSVKENQLDGQLLMFDGNSSSCLRYDLEMLILSYNEFTGPLPDKLGQLKHLKHLDLSGNNFTGAIPVSLGNLLALRELQLSECQLSGSVPTSLGNLTALQWLSLNDNRLDGTLAVSLGKLSNLEHLDLSSNSLKGIITEDHFAKLTRLEYIRMDFNLLTFKVKSDWKPPFQLYWISIKACKMEGGFPQWLQTQSRLYSVDFSYTSISGPLSHDMGDQMHSLENLHLAGNALNGVIPNSLCKLKTLQVLDLSRNSFSGSIPDCWNDNGSLVVLKLSSNRLSGNVPKSIRHLNSISWLYLNNNSFSGNFPSALRSSSELQVLDIGDNGFSGDLPKWIGTELQNLRALRLHNNLFTGSIHWEFCQLQWLHIMDLSGNKLTGNLPSCLGNLSSMKGLPDSFGIEWDEEDMLQGLKGLVQEYSSMELVLLVNLDLSNNNLVGEIPEGLTDLSGLLGLNLSSNSLTGIIPRSIGNMKSLESLDLSHNHLSSEIPASIANLTSLAHLNLSYNNLSGQIPIGPQLQTLDDPSIYVGNPQLCGALLKKKCKADGPPQSQPGRDHHEGKKTEDALFYITVMTGFVTGFWTVVAVLVFKRNWRCCLFRFTDAVMERILLEITLKLRKLKR